MWGVSMTGGAKWGDIFTQQYALILTAVDQLRTRRLEMHQPSPVLEFFRLETAAGQVLRAVDFADKDASATKGSVDFNGETYPSIGVARSAIEESIDGKLPSINLTFLDPTRALASFVKANSLEDAKLEWWLTTYDKITDSTLAEKMTFRVRNASISEGPASVTISLGPPKSLDESFPYVLFNRWRCKNVYPIRHVHDNAENLCDYPSDEFQENTRQAFTFGNGSAAEKTLNFGWFVRNADNGSATFHEIGLLPVGRTVSRVADLKQEQGDIRWDDAVQKGLFVYKKIGVDSTEETDIDVFTKAELIGTKPNQFLGLLVQSITDTDDWILFGLRETTAPTVVFRTRLTDADVSTDTDYTDNGDRVLRIQRTGTSWKFYTAAETIDSIDPVSYSWTLHATETLSLADPIRVGVVLASDDTVSGARSEAYFHYLRFLKGGLPTCNRSLADCLVHGNERKFNGFLGLPDQLRGFV